MTAPEPYEPPKAALAEPPRRSYGLLALILLGVSGLLFVANIAVATYASAVIVQPGQSPQQAAQEMDAMMPAFVISAVLTIGSVLCGLVSLIFAVLGLGTAGSGRTMAVLTLVLGAIVVVGFAILVAIGLVFA